MNFKYELELEKSESAFMVIGNLMRYMHLSGREGINIDYGIPFILSSCINL